MDPTPRSLDDAPGRMTGMALNEGDQEKVPPELTATDCYERIWLWHRANGAEKATKRQLSSNNMRQYLALLPELPTDSDAEPEDIDFLFREVLNGTFEWSYHEEDSRGIKMAAYAFHGVEKQHHGDMGQLAYSAARSSLNDLKS